MAGNSVENEAQGSQLGSLGPFVEDEHIGRYDLVSGNPPWSSGTKLPEWNLVRAAVGRIAAERKVAAAPLLPNEVLDIPFVWRAMEWAKPGGQIAFALHARLLFQQGDGMAEARLALFDALDVTSIINGSELRQTKVWPEISAPFCLLFATNRTPDSSAGFRLISRSYPGWFSNPAYQAAWWPVPGSSPGARFSSRSAPSGGLSGAAAAWRSRTGVARSGVRGRR
jgi:hypothetical protein